MASISSKVAVTQMVNIKKTVFFNSFGSLKNIHFLYNSIYKFWQIFFFDINKFSCYSPGELGK